MKMIMIMILISLLCITTINYGDSLYYEDKNKDGINDLFRDVNGDGINDISSKPYLHSFKYSDKNKDDMNDFFSDSDGDGVNDIPGTPYPVLDFNGDMKNDITGLPYFRHWFNGFRFGFIIEENNTVIKDFVDMNNDGMDDRVHPRKIKDMEILKNQDRFFDRNRDGFNDRFIRRKRGPVAPPPRHPIRP